MVRTNMLRCMYSYINKKAPNAHFYTNFLDNTVLCVVDIIVILNQSEEQRTTNTAIAQANLFFILAICIIPN